ncbi:nicotinamide riboside kinase [Emericellopsis cladophorae]|uniref:Nicotinamide riboside kinase n=1 Tax=Emericellopsis cladophorae TaxID=2686198 RepID=A0A9P9XZX2_9HYPO|nr:nicotinamide riboside kinase [Emericellopsis cladophorae]KAI6780573.1 nicotinamide riboside kinase [Emericellopsis cladophorae]
MAVEPVIQGLNALDKTTQMLRDRILMLLERQQEQACQQNNRVLVALAGVPGSGKSTVGNALLRVLPLYNVKEVCVLPMDGFHHTKEALMAFDDPALAFQKRGAPFTFDAEAFFKLVQCIKETPVTRPDEKAVTFLAPDFDHAVGDPVPDAIQISSAARIVIVEGNYTLLDEEPWNKIAALVDDRWFVDVTPDVARERLAKRHMQAGIEKTYEAAVARAEDNDLPNGALIRSKLIRPDVRILN